MRYVPAMLLSVTLLCLWQSAASSEAPGSASKVPEQSVVKPQGDPKPGGSQSQEPECE